MLTDVAYIGGCCNKAVNQPRVDIRFNAGLHSKVPLISLVRLMHLGIPLALRVLGG